ncbi:MAG: RtcB family protein, partial [Actinomycetia bacterium]|nr:RtcB family protein [Actinomycetes bacterium]
MAAFEGPLERVEETVWRIPRSYKEGMLVDGLIYSSPILIDQVVSDRAPEQVANVAFLPGIVTASLAMPDIHWGYGFAIGGVCATDPAAGGVVSPGGVGYDINCGVRLIRTDLSADDVTPIVSQLVDSLFAHIPVGVGQGSDHHFDDRELDRLMAQGPS